MEMHSVAGCTHSSVEDALTSSSETIYVISGFIFNAYTPEDIYGFLM